MTTYRRGSRSALLLLSASAGLLASEPSRALSASFVFRNGVSAASIAGLGTSAVAVSGAEPATLTLDLEVGIGSEGLIAIAHDIEFDLGPDFDDELDILSFSELSWESADGTHNLRPISPGLAWIQESNAQQEGQLFGFEAFTLGSGPINVTLSFARAVFVTNPPNVQTDGDDIFTTNGNPIDCRIVFWFGGCSNELLFAAARVDLIPEPASGALLGLGLAALAAALRWAR